MERQFMFRYWKMSAVPMLLSGFFIVFLSGCGPSQQEIAQREEDARIREETAQRLEMARVAEEKARQEKIAARQAELIRIEQGADRAAQAGDVDAALTGYKELLQVSQGNMEEDQRLREKIIKFVVSLKTPPPITEEVRRQVVRAQTMIRMNQGVGPAAAELASAMILAPWWADGYYNLGLMQEGAGNFTGAIRSLKLCLLADPHAPNAEAIQNKIYELEVLKENDDKTSAMSGKWTNSKTGNVYTVSMDGNIFQAINRNKWILRGVKSGNMIEGTITVPAMALWSENRCISPKYTVPLSGQISQDGKSITFHYIENTYNSTHWNITYSGLFAVNNTGHSQGECISVTLQGSHPSDFTIAR